jgi:hypothetical protein
MALPKKPTELAQVFFDKGLMRRCARMRLTHLYNDPHSRALFEIAHRGLAMPCLTDSPGVRAT